MRFQVSFFDKFFFIIFTGKTVFFAESLEGSGWKGIMKSVCDSCFTRSDARRRAYETSQDVALSVPTHSTHLMQILMSSCMHISATNILYFISHDKIPSRYGFTLKKLTV